MQKNTNFSNLFLSIFFLAVDSRPQQPIIERAAISSATSSEGAREEDTIKSFES